MMNQGSNRPETPDNHFLLRESASKNGSTPRGTRKGADFHEKQPLFDRPAEPVKLTPAWEETNLPNDELNFKGVTMEQADLEINPPLDRCKLVYLTLILHGIGTLMPWNMFINAKAYFEDYKLDRKYTGFETDHKDTFMFYLCFASQIPNVIFNWLNIFVQIGGNLTTRIVWSIMIEVLLFIFTIVLAMSDSSGWPSVFFWSTIVTVILLNMANGIYQNTVYGMAAKLPFKYTGAVILGSNISGTVSSVLNIVARLLTPGERTAAIYYFITALFILLVCFDTYFALPLNRFYRYHELLSVKSQPKKQVALQAKPNIPYFQIFKKCFPQLFNVFFVFFITLALFPAILSEVDIVTDSPFFVGEEFFVDVSCFLTFNVFAMIGSLVATLGVWPGPKYLVIPVVLRVLFIPFFLLCNYAPTKRSVTSVLIGENYAYWSGVILLGLTSGFWSAVGMMYCPRSVEPQHAATAGMFGAAALITGIFSGILLSFALPQIVPLIPL